MKPTRLSQRSAAELVACFVDIALAQDEAIWDYRSAEYNRLYRDMKAVTAELRARPGDGRRALVGLFDHRNPQVRSRAAIETLALEPIAARAVLEEISARPGPWRLDAGMILRGLDDGTFVPS